MSCPFSRSPPLPSAVSLRAGGAPPLGSRGPGCSAPAPTAQVHRRDRGKRRQPFPRCCASGGLRERRKVAPFPAASPGAAELASPGRTEQFPPLPSGAFAAAKPRYPGDHGEQNNTPPRPSRSRRTSLVICSVSPCSRDHRRIYNCDLSPRRRSWMNSLPAGQRITSRLIIITVVKDQPFPAKLGLGAYSRRGRGGWRAKPNSILCV